MFKRIAQLAHPQHKFLPGRERQKRTKKTSTNAETLYIRGLQRFVAPCQFRRNPPIGINLFELCMGFDAPCPVRLVSGQLLITSKRTSWLYLSLY
ncbi:hypothetical protein SAMN04487894_10315 [Niabella drilacis]|uniref:Uncharacterized protein n=1 Tax=Niabella drilacis (strain DSM 25811 / CCM 8410 / CCUG 62505 / LMG 26954 / E90) TaxID=1285928 RepID=A0A1G6MRS2_NIADE|nr:hypothetical protein SAMN04487894_10315 [Niabella drilacis]